MTSPRLVERMTNAARKLITSLQPAQRERTMAPFDTPDHRIWTYYSGPRPGLVLADMSPPQRALALALLDSGCSAAGALAARSVIDLDAITNGAEGEGQYWLRILGEPGSHTPWAWRVNGHHLAVHVTIVGNAVSATPFFLGAKPATVLTGPHAGLRTLQAEEDLARALLETFNQTQRATAVIDVPPEDIMTRSEPQADPTRVPIGLPYSAMNQTQQQRLRSLISLYLGRAAQPVADEAWQEAIASGLNRITFAWAGSSRSGEGHYYAVRSPAFLLEYDNTQQNANHIHTVWRDLRKDWGADLLAEHIRSRHRFASYD